MEGLVNYSSEDEQDDYPYAKVAVRERGGGSSGRTATDASGLVKRPYEPPRSGSCEREDSPFRKGRDTGSERYKSGNNYNEDKYKIDRRSDKSRDHRDKRDYRDSRNNRDDGRDGRDYDNNSHNHNKYDYKKHDDHKRYSYTKRDHRREDNDYYRDDKRYNRYDDRKSSSYNPNHKDRFNTSKSRYDDRKQYDDRYNDERRSGGGGGQNGSNYDERRRDDRRNNDDERRHDRRYNDDRRTQRSYNDERSNNYRPRRSNSPASSQRNSSSSNKYAERKDDSGRRERKRHSRSRSRTPHSQSPDNGTESNITSNNVLHPRTTAAGEQQTETKEPEPESQTTEKKPLPSARNFEALLSLPLSENAPKQPNIVTVPATSTAAGLNTSTTTVQLPSYYNPNVINPNKYVEQMQKRKLIWGAKKTEDSAAKWGHAQFSQDQDGKVASKFMRLMGIKNAGGSSDSTAATNDNEKKSPSSSTSPSNNIDVKSREAMFSTMEQQYEVARQVTHTMRGVGLGFGSQSRPY